MLPGRPVGNMYFAAWSHNVISNAVSLSNDLKQGEYRKFLIPGTECSMRQGTKILFSQDPPSGHVPHADLRHYHRWIHKLRRNVSPPWEKVTNLLSMRSIIPAHWVKSQNSIPLRFQAITDSKTCRISIVNGNRELLASGNGNNSWSGATMQSYNTNAASWALAGYLYKSGRMYEMVPIGLAIGAGAVALHRLIYWVRELLSPFFLTKISS